MRYPHEQYATVSQAPLSEFGAMFSNFKTSAFRLELLPQYDVPQETSAFADYKSGGRRPIDFNSDWLDILKTANSRGAKVTRVRLIETLTDYISFEIDWGYKYNIEKGELVKKISLDELRETMHEVDISFIKDFWIFDREHFYFMNYDFFGRFLGVSTASDELNSLILNLADRLTDKSIIINI